jgi:hypothetical protein
LSAAAVPPDVAGVVDHLFRREAGRLVAILAGRLGAAHLQHATSAVRRPGTSQAPRSGCALHPDLVRLPGYFESSDFRARPSAPYGQGVFDVKKSLATRSRYKSVPSAVSLFDPPP